MTGLPCSRSIDGLAHRSAFTKSVASRALSRFGATMVLAIAFAAVAGCGESGESLPVAQLAGTVTLDGKPLEKGTVVFAARSGDQAPSTSAEIVGGKYQADAVPLGTVSVIFSAVRETGQQNTEYSEPFAETVNIIPEKYRDGIELEVSGDNLQQDFALLSK